MTTKSSKSLAKDLKTPGPAAGAGRSRDQRASKKTLRPVREGPDNLRRRAEYFRRRSAEK